MIYLKPLIGKLADGENSKQIINQANQMKSDRELLDYFSKVSSTEKIQAAFKHHYGIEYVSLKERTIDSQVLSRFNLSFLKEEKVIPFAYNEEKKVYHFSISNLVERGLRGKIEKVAKSNNQKVLFFFTFEHEILDKLREIENNVGNIQESSQGSEGDFNVVDWVNGIINKGIELNASDIHIERLEHEMQIRYRVDGLLTNKEKYRFTDSVISNIYVRLKIISNMDIVESRKSQDGRIDNYQHDGKAYDLRVNTVNTIHGEKFVLRLLIKSDEIESFSELGFSRENENKIKNMLSNQNGIIYLAGATGSGKTTTLYSMIDELNNDYVNIYTIEDPVEKTINNVNQIQIDEASGTDYPTILSALLRQDPNVIVVGEIRDAETANLSIRASLTGHLVLTTLHANNALESLSRLSDMDIKNYLIGASSIGFLSQRLIRQLCSHCKLKKEELSIHEDSWIKEEIHTFNYDEEKLKGNYIYEASSCDKCMNGYKGRIAVVEVLEVDDELRTMISQEQEINKIKKIVESKGYKSLKHDGIIKALNGITSIDELIGQV